MSPFPIQILTLFILVAGVVIAARAIKANREINARRAYFDYVKVAFDNPDFAFPKHSEFKFDYKKQEIDGSRTRFEKYEWFVSLLVVTVEGVLEITESKWLPMTRKSVWAVSAETQLSYHTEYFRLYRTKPWLSAKFRTSRILDRMFSIAKTESAPNA